jgi:hypothetical protein
MIGFAEKLENAGSDKMKKNENQVPGKGILL